MSVSWAGSGSLVFSSVFSAVVFAEEVNVGDEESGDTTTVDVQALLEAFFEHYYYLNFIIIPCNIKYYFECPAYCTMFYY